MDGGCAEHDKSEISDLHDGLLKPSHVEIVIRPVDENSGDSGQNGGKAADSSDFSWTDRRDGRRPLHKLRQSPYANSAPCKQGELLDSMDYEVRRHILVAEDVQADVTRAEVNGISRR